VIIKLITKYHPVCSLAYIYQPTLKAFKSKRSE
jgi:hypothetical protein